MSDTNPLEELIDAIGSGNFNQSEKLFNQEVGARMQDALDAEKINVANQIFNTVTDEEVLEDDGLMNEIDKLEDEYDAED